MKNWISMVAGGVLLLVCLATAGYWFAVPSRRVEVRFVGFEAGRAQGWKAVFQATNATSATVFCRPSLQLGTNHFTIPTGSLKILGPLDIIGGYLDPGTGQKWAIPISDTNSIDQLEVTCFGMQPSLVRWLSGWLPLDIRMLFPRGADYTVICPVEPPRVRISR